jgi:hypothetical protein
MTAMKRLLALLLLTFSANADVLPSPTKAELHEWMREAMEMAEKVPADERRDLAMSFANSEYTAREDQIKAALLSIALRPQFYGPYRLLRTMSEPRAVGLVKAEEIAADEKAATEFIEEIYRPRIGVSSQEARDWQSGLADFYATTGRFKDALTLQRPVTEIDGSAYDKVFVAVLEKLNGNDAPFAAIMANCPPPPEQYAHMGATYCVQAARSIVQRMAISGPLTKVAQEILAGRAMPMDWSNRMHGMHTLVANSPDAAEQELRSILADPKAPEWIKQDALAFLVEAAVVRQDSAKILALTECFLTRRGVAFPAVSADTWQQLIMMEPLPANRVALTNAGDDHVCFQHDSDKAEPFVLTEGCTSEMLMRQLSGALNTRNIPAARRAVERMASVVATKQIGIAHLNQMFVLYAAMTREQTAGQFAALLPGERDGVLEEHLREPVRQQTKRVGEPWAAPTNIETKASVCP